MTEARDVFKNLETIGCCIRCCIRYLGDPSPNFSNPKIHLEELFIISNLDSEESSKKRIKLSPCILCLGLLEDYFLDELLAKLDLDEISKYATTSYSTCIQFPGNILIRDKSVKVYIQQNFNDFFQKHNLENNITPINKAWKFSIIDKMDKALNKKFSSRSNMAITFRVTSDICEEEMKVLYQLEPATYRKRIKHKLAENVFSKSIATNTLGVIDTNTFKQHVPVPPQTPSNSVQFLSLDINSDPIFICGRYCKYSRNMGQTPWTPNNATVPVLGSVQDILFDAIVSVLGYRSEQLTFSASGREDFDTRCLGSGRPFYIQVQQPKRLEISSETFRKLEIEINQSPVVSVFDVQQCDKSALKHIKVGEEFKLKTYIALCYLRNDNFIQEDILKRINKTSSIEIFQKTPLRVLHRRSLKTRKKTIYSLQAAPVKGFPNLLEVQMTTQAGTYVKEFVHDDHGRTTPSLKDITGTNIDIFKLDVIGVHLDWPPHINSVKDSRVDILNTVPSIKNEAEVNSDSIREQSL